MEQEFKVSKIQSNINNSLKKPAFIPFIVAGYPDMNTTKELLYCLQESGAAAIELGLPFSDPLADGPVIQEAANEALKEGANIEKVFELLSEIKDDFKTPIILFTYFNLVLNYGLEKFVKKAKENNIEGFIVPDLPYEESDEFNSLCRKAEIDHIMLIAPTSSNERIEKIAKHSSGFIYMVSSTGVTGVRASFSETLGDIVEQIRHVSNVPVAVGFGVSRQEHIQKLAQMNIDGAIVGSAIVKLIKEYKNDKSLMLEKLAAYINELYTG